MEPGHRGHKKTDAGETAPAVPMAFGSTVTLLFSDIRGFTEYTNQHGDEAAFQVLQEHNAIVRKQIETFGGQVVKTQGDSFMVAFTTARGAIPARSRSSARSRRRIGTTRAPGSRSASGSTPASRSVRRTAITSAAP